MTDKMKPINYFKARLLRGEGEEPSIFFGSILPQCVVKVVQLEPHGTKVFMHVDGESREIEVDADVKAIQHMIDQCKLLDAQESSSGTVPT